MLVCVEHKKLQCGPVDTSHIHSLQKLHKTQVLSTAEEQIAALVIFSVKSIDQSLKNVYSKFQSCSSYGTLIKGQTWSNRYTLIDLLTKMHILGAVWPVDKQIMVLVLFNYLKGCVRVPENYVSNFRVVAHVEHQKVRRGPIGIPWFTYNSFIDLGPVILWGSSIRVSGQYVWNLKALAHIEHQQVQCGPFGILWFS